MSFDDLANNPNAKPLSRGGGAASPTSFSSPNSHSGLSSGVTVSSSHSAGIVVDEPTEKIISQLNRLQMMIDNIIQIEGNVTELLEMMGTSRDSKENRARMFALLSQCEKQCRDGAVLFKSILLLPVTACDGYSEKEIKARRERLRVDLMRYSETFGKLGTQAKAKAAQPIPLKHSLARDEGEAERTPLLDAQRNEIEQVGNQLDFNDQLILDRNDSIQSLETEIVAVNDIVHDLAKLISEQQELVNKVEDDIIGADVAVEKGVEELGAAHESVKKSRSKLCIIMFIALAIVVAIAVAITLGILL
ncbi:hypothetical protein Pelo_6055 [Pelomyxa schiedti]|nr:hypothetical protein Pelo_6055 [Pelomyxa schiedti]